MKLEYIHTYIGTLVDDHDSWMWSLIIQTTIMCWLANKLSHGVLWILPIFIHTYILARLILSNEPRWGGVQLLLSTGRHFIYVMYKYLHTDVLTPKNLRNNSIQRSIPKPIPFPHLSEHGQPSPSLPQPENPPIWLSRSSSPLQHHSDPQRLFFNASLLAPTTPSGISLLLKGPLHTRVASGAIFSNAARRRLYFMHSIAVTGRKGRRLLVPTCRMMSLMEG